MMGGTDAQISEFPFIGAVQMNLGDGSYARCGCAILSKRSCLTAAHCLKDSYGRNLPKSAIKVYFGSNVFSYGDVSYVEGIYKHPQYGTTIYPRDFDFALLELKDALVYKANAIQPIEMTDDDDESLGEAWIAGWGKYSRSSGGSAILQKAKMSGMSLRDCENYYQNTLTWRMICLKAYGISACNG